MIIIKAIFLLTILLSVFGSNNGESKKNPVTPEKVMKLENELNLDFKAIMDKCNETYKIDMSYLESLNDSGSFPDESDKSAKCYIRCMLEETGIFVNSETFDVNLTAKIFAGVRNAHTMTDLEDLAQSCAASRDETCRCERSYEFIKCFMEKEIEKYEENDDKNE